MLELKFDLFKRTDPNDPWIFVETFKAPADLKVAAESQGVIIGGITIEQVGRQYRSSYQIIKESDLSSYYKVTNHLIRFGKHVL